ncbi:LacI family DNA-binding transcriptional regulator [Pontiella agarivorans]|uniref:LacI family DNA-binding transcriptional regulator n=1 Tax=Pontiella agarivorans TaxID=3038953 RepID=A0ABU5MWW2_9BACT|nr:LacI family DNA-binding transcriptional regulator [Pontiella agarivorans]MDZ8118451.1 LacI family DNA-binding transcriptional regulator [Pontiella agarivorans]
MNHDTYKKNTATLAQVAQASGVSRQTAGRILGGKAHKHKPDTVERVKQIAEDLGYRTNLLAKSVVAGKTYSIGVLVPRANRDSFFADIITGIQDALIDTEWVPIILQTSEKSGERSCIRQQVERRVDGILLIPHENHVDANHFSEIIERQIPVVIINARLQNIAPVDFIGTDEFEGGKRAAEYLLSISRRWKFGIVRNAGPSQNLGQRAQGFLQTLENERKKCRELKLISWKTEDNLPALTAFLKKKDRPNALFCITDIHAAQVYKAAWDLGLHIPSDLAVVGYADLDFAPYLSPSLTTFRQDGKAIGQAAAEKLLSRIQQGPVEASEILQPPELIERQSVK